MANDKFEGMTKKVEGSLESGFGNLTGNASTEAKGTAKKALGSAQEAIGDAKDYAQESWESVTAHINEKPVQSALIALGVGYLLSRLFRV